MNSPDDELLQRCRDGEREAWQLLVERHGGFVFGVACGTGLDRERAADVSQIVFVALHQSLGELQDGSALRGWLVTVTRRHAWRALAARRGEGVREVPLEQDVPAADPGEANVGEEMEQLVNALRRLGPRCRDLLELLYLSGGRISYQEVAVRLEMPIGSIGPTRARCLAQLRELATKSDRSES